jgi:branched-subunit amino acid aminotransferase/4-amino-4-deoxychorismate lyase
MLVIDGAPATADDLAPPALVNHGAYTSFRVESGAVRGLGLHLARLEAASVELFGEVVQQERLRDLIRVALAGRDAAWLRVSLFAPEISHRQVAWTGRPRVMIGVFDPPAPLGPCRVMPLTYLREAPHLKHVATMGLIRARRAAVQAGFDDALFTDAEGRVLEGTLWNVGFVRGDEVVWPEGPKLEGVAQALIQRNLDAVGMTSCHAVVRLGDLPTFDHAFLCNSATPAAALTAIGGHTLDPAPDVVARLAAAWSAAPPEKI